METSDQDVPHKTEEEMRQFFQFKDFQHFLSVVGTCLKYITSERQFERIAYEMLEDQAASNVRYVEAIFAAPIKVKHGLDYSLMLDSINRGIRKAKNKYGIECSLRIDLIRDYGPESAMEFLEQIDGKRDNVKAVDLGGSETRFPLKPFKHVFMRAREMGFHLVAHAGEDAGPQGVWDAVELLQVERIGHGIAASEDPSLLEVIKEREIGLEVCPISNVRTGVVPSIQEHPIRELYDLGIKITVNTDDPSMFGTDMNNEFYMLHKHLGFTPKELFQISLIAVDSSFLLEQDKREMRESFLEEYRSLTN